MSVSSDYDTLDFESLGEPIIGFNLPNSLDDNPEDVANYDETDQDIPTTKKDALDRPAEKLSEEAKRALICLGEVCSALGVNKTMQMENQIKTMSKTESIKEDHVIWYVRGISLANNTNVLSAITESISDLKSESRHLSNVTNKTSKVAASVDKVSVGLRSLLEDITSKVKESFDKTMKALADSYDEKIQLMSEASKLPAATISVSIPDPPVSEVTIEKRDAKTAKKDTGGERSVDGQIDQPMVTHATDENIQKDKKALMLRVGVGASVVKELKDTSLNAVLPDGTYTELKNMVLTPKVCTGIKQLLMTNLKCYIASMTPSVSGTK